MLFNLQNYQKALIFFNSKTNKLLLNLVLKKNICLLLKLSKQKARPQIKKNYDFFNDFSNRNSDLKVYIITTD